MFRCIRGESQLSGTLRTTQFVQGLLRVRVPVAALSNVIGLQLDAGSDGGDRLVTGLQMHAGEKGQAARTRLIFNPLIEA